MWGLAIYSYMPYSIHGYIFERTGIYGLVWWRRPSHAHYRHVVTRSDVHSRRGRKISCRTRTGGNHEAIGTITWPGWQHRNRMARGRWSGQLVWAELGSKQRHQKFVTGRPDGGSRSRTFRPLLRRRWRTAGQVQLFDKSSSFLLLEGQVQCGVRKYSPGDRPCFGQAEWARAYPSLNCKSGS